MNEPGQIWYECLYCKFTTLQYGAMVKHLEKYHYKFEVMEYSKRDLRIIGEMIKPQEA